jgi:hypothetical protein
MSTKNSIKKRVSKERKARTEKIAEACARKRTFQEEGQAFGAAHAVNRKIGGDKKVKAYHCPVCNLYHLTSSPT